MKLPLFQIEWGAIFFYIHQTLLIWLGYRLKFNLRVEVKNRNVPRDEIVDLQDLEKYILTGESKKVN